jgi:predicted  nucleic acid-binding Zn-ribbon protein
MAGTGRREAKDVEAREQLIHLVNIQNLAITIGEDRKIIDQAPFRIEEIEGRFRDRNTEYVAVKDRFDELEKDIRERNLELETLIANRKKYSEDLMQVQNQREYSAILKEIDEVKARIADHEEAVLSNMEEIETLKGQIESMGEHISVEREKVAVETGEVKATIEKAEAEVARCIREREMLEGELPPALAAALRRVEGQRHGLFLVEVVDGTCQACYVRVRPQVYQEIKAASKLHNCGSCRRFLYHAPSLRPALEEPAAPEDLPTSGAEAMNDPQV